MTKTTDIIDMQDKQLVTNSIKEIIEKRLDIDSFKLNDNFKNDLGCDSLDFIEIVMDSEKCFDLKPINDDVLENVKTPAQLIHEVWVRL